MVPANVASCAELTETHADEAARSSISMRAFMRWAADTARPEEGAPKILLSIARLAYAAWLEGTPFVEIHGDEMTTTISIYCDYGVDLRERIVPVTRLAVPFDEFVRAVRLAPQLVRPFQVTIEDDSLTLAPPGAHRASGHMRRNAIAIDRRSLHGAMRSPLEHGLRPVAAAPAPVAEHSGVHTRPTPLQTIAVRDVFLRGNED
jgi:hypothetical protein